MPLMPVMILAMFGQKEWRSRDLWSCDHLQPVDCIQANKISHGGLWCNDRFSKVPAGIAEGAETRVQGLPAWNCWVYRGSGMRVMPRSYGQRSFIMCSHWKCVCQVRFIMCSHWICYLAVILDMCLMPLVVCAWWLFLILTFVFHKLISPCGLMDTYDWVIAYVSYSN